MERLTIDTDRCVGCGQCALACEFDALSTPWGVVRVSADLCVSCGSCVEFCPVEALSLEEG